MYSLEDALTKDFYEKNEERFENLKAGAKKQGVCFILGAGVGQSVGLPQWNKLISKAIGVLLYNWGIGKNDDILSIYQYARDHEDKKFRDGVAGNYESVWNISNTLEMAEYILNYHQNHLKAYDNTDIKKGIAEKQLLALIRCCIHCNKDEIEEIYKNKYEKDGDEKKPSTLKSITDTIKSHFDSKGTQTVITYNYDNLLEYSLMNKHGISSDQLKVIAYKGRTIHNPQNDKQIEEGKINICHIHGYIDITENKDECDGLILSESSYRDIEQSEYNWINTCQATAMQDNTCVLIGFSGEDYNFRRIVRKNHDGESYIFFAIDDIVNNIFSEEANKLVEEKGMTWECAIEYILKEKTVCCYEKFMMEFWIFSKTKYWESFNVYPIWTTLEELPRRILEL